MVSRCCVEKFRHRRSVISNFSLSDNICTRTVRHFFHFVKLFREIRDKTYFRVFFSQRTVIKIDFYPSFSNNFSPWTYLGFGKKKFFFADSCNTVRLYIIFTNPNLYRASRVWTDNARLVGYYYFIQTVFFSHRNRLRTIAVCCGVSPSSSRHRCLYRYAIRKDILL